MTFARLLVSASLAFGLVSTAAAQQRAPEPVFKFSGKVQTLNGEIKSITLWEDGRIASQTYKGAHALFNSGAKIYGMGPKGELIDSGMTFIRPMGCGEIENLANNYLTDKTLTKGKPAGTAKATVDEFFKGWQAAGCAEEGRKFPGRATPRPLIN